MFPTLTAITSQIIVAYSPCLSAMSHSNCEKVGSYHLSSIYIIVQFPYIYIVVSKLLMCISMGNNLINNSTVLMCCFFCLQSQSHPPVFFVHAIFQARILEWVAITFSKGSFPPMDRTRVSCTAERFCAESLQRIFFAENCSIFFAESYQGSSALEPPLISKVTQVSIFSSTPFSEVVSHICDIIRLFHHSLHSILGSPGLLND